MLPLCVRVCVCVPRAEGARSRHKTLLVRAHTRACNRYYFVIFIIFLTFSTFSIHRTSEGQVHVLLSQCMDCFE